MNEEGIARPRASGLAQPLAPSGNDGKLFENGFKHDPLDREQISIRVLRVLPERSEQGYIQCTMRHTDIEDQYECLSYVWGDPSSEHHRILVNGHVFWVRDNLWKFLSVAVSTPRYRSFNLWVDAICIDQNNVLERNHQVRYMGTIFKSAVGVLVWLGNDKKIVDFMALLCEKPGTLTQLYKQDQEVPSSPEWAEFEILMNGRSSFNNAPYWQRAWTTQEFALARRIVFSCGNQSIGEDKMSMVSYEYPNGAERLVGYSLEKHSVHRADQHALRQGLRKGLVKLVTQFRYKECQIARDKIYSLLELSSDGHELIPDYEASNEEVLLRTFEGLQSAWCICELCCVAGIFGQIDDCALVGYVFEFEMSNNWLRDWAGSLKATNYGAPHGSLCERCAHPLPDETSFRETYAYTICLYGLCNKASAHLLFDISDLEGGVTVDAYESSEPGGSVSNRYFRNIRVNLQEVSTEEEFACNIQIPLQDVRTTELWQWGLEGCCVNHWNLNPSCRVKPGRMENPLLQETVIRCLCRTHRDAAINTVL